MNCNDGSSVDWEAFLTQAYPIQELKHATTPDVPLFRGGLLRGGDLGRTG